jgi:serine/threonine-protein kinase PpkA
LHARGVGMSEPKDPSQPTGGDLTGRIGKYEIVRPLGKGAMGQVYLAHDTDLDREVALKVMAAQIADDPELKTRFEREARAVARMKHRNVVTIFERGTHTDGSPYIAMEYLEGQDLQKALRQVPPMKLEDKVTVIGQVLAGLAHAHDKGIFHRDIKPANIFIQRDGSVKIMDFGVARLTSAPMTGTGNIVGTADYMSPEQVQGQKIDHRSDLFSVGCMLYELVVGRRPFHADNLMAIFYRITHEGANFDLIPQGSEHDALLPILKKALARSLEERYQTAYEFAVDLRDWLKGHATTASSQNVLEALVDLEAPTHPPLPLTEAPGRTDAPQRPTVDLGRRGPRRTPTGAGGRTAAEGAGATMRPGPTRVAGGPPSPRVPARARPEPRSSVLPWVATAVALAAVSVAGWLAWQGRQAPETPPVTRPAATPTPLPPVTIATPEPPPVTAAPAPRFQETSGRAAASVRAARAAFDAGDYDTAVASAQAALREDARNETAKRVLDQALVGQKATEQVRAGQAALARGDIPAAEAGAAEALRLAPWDAGTVELSRRIEAARRQALRDADDRARLQRAAQITRFLNEADARFADKQYAAAIARYDDVLDLEPGNAVALQGKSNVRAAQAIAESASAAGPRPGGPVRTFVAGRTEAKGGEPAGLVGFEDSAGVGVKKGTQAAELPGRIVFEASPAAPKGGERFRVSVFLSNEGSQAIELATMSVTTILDGKRQSGAVPPAAATVAPRQRALVYQTPTDVVWREGTAAWTMEIALRTRRGETYRNTLAWK